MNVQLVHGDVPKSLNSIGSRGNWWLFHAEKKKWQSIFEALLMAQLPRKKQANAVTVTAVLRFPTKRRRDEGNYRSLIEKALGDALVNGGWLKDDTPGSYRFERLYFDSEKGAAQTLVNLEMEF